MRNFKILLSLLMTLALIAAGANLPRFVSDRMDREIMGQSGSRDMASIALDLSGENRKLTTAEKITLLSRGKTIAVSENEASMTMAEVNAAVEKQMEAYIDAGIFEWFEYTSWITQPYLCVDPQAPENFALFWTVTIVNEMHPYQTLGVDIDDETGTIYSIRYDQLGSFPVEDVWEQNYANMDAFVHVYLNQLGLLDANMEPHLEYGELDGLVLCAEFVFTEAGYGKCALEFYMTAPGGYWIYFPA